VKKTSSEKANNKTFRIYKIYIKDVSFETPNSPDVFVEEWKPSIDLQIATDARKLRKSTYEVTLALTVTTRMNEKTAYLVEIHEAGIFGLRGYEGDHLDYMLHSYCPNILYPFAREAAVNLVQKGGFEQLILLPIDFDNLHQQTLEAARQTDEKDTGEEDS
jgi:preprotein translocase subunit SecB